MKRFFLSLFLAVYVTMSISGCKSLVTSAPEQWVAKIDDAMVLIEDTKGLIELAKELGMEWVTLVKQKDGTYTVKDHTEKIKPGNEVMSNAAPGARIQGIASTSLAPGTQASTPLSQTNELRIPIEDIIRRTRVVH